MVIAIIPAKGESNRIPNKNTAFLCGQHLLAYPILAAQKSGCIDKIIVSSDSDEVLNIAKAYNVETNKRPNYLCRFDVPVDEVIVYTAKQYEFDKVITLLPTMPFLKSDTIKRAVSACENGYTVMTMIQDSFLRWSRENGGLRCISNRVNSQLMPVSYIEAGGLIVCSKEQINKGTRMGDKIKAEIIGSIEALDINRMDDFFIAESVGKMLPRGNLWT